MKLFIKLNAIHKLQLLNDKLFVTRILPLLTGDMFILLGERLSEGNICEQYINCYT
jgi:hypothetical protein